MVSKKSVKVKLHSPHSHVASDVRRVDGGIRVLEIANQQQASPAFWRISYDFLLNLRIAAAAHMINNQTL